MGKDKQRTKGGVKPSRSDRTAELLAKSQNVSFESQSVFSNYVPVISFGCGDIDSLDSSLSPELRLVLRKLSKKDATTKIKALGELSEICLQTPETCNDILQYWPRIYSRLATDDSRKVRELSHGVLEIIGKQVGRNLAPHLKSIAPYWFLGQSDIFAPASTTATNGFKAVFSTEKKQTEAIIFCLSEIFSLVTEIFTTSKALKPKPNKKDAEKLAEGESSSSTSTVTAPPPSTSDDFENYELRMLYSSLQSLRKLVELNIGEDEQYLNVLNLNEFWALTKHSCSSIRRQLYDLIATLANNKPHLIQQKCTKTITQSLREESSDCLPSLWNCFLALTLNCPSFITGPKSQLHDKLLSVCKKGFHGNARTLGPSVLPLVAKIGIDENFISLFLLALQEGYKSEKSLMEKSAILRVFAEVLAYHLSVATTDTSKLLDDVVFPFIDTLISFGNVRDFAKTLGSLVKKDYFYTHLSEWLTNQKEEATGEESSGIKKWDSKNCGQFIVHLCTESSPATSSNSTNDPGQKVKSVKFQTKETSTCSLDEEIFDYAGLPDYKRVLVKSIADKCLSSNNLNTFLALSNFHCEQFYNDVTDNKPVSIIESDAFNNSDKESKLAIILRLIKAFPTVPSFLSKLSSLFEQDYNNITDFKIFIVKINDYQNIPCVKRWLKQDMFCTKVKDLITKLDDLGDLDSMVALKFILHSSSLFGNELTDSISSAICNQIKICDNANDRFITDVLRLVKGMIEKRAGENLSCIMTGLFERLIYFSITTSDVEVNAHVEFMIEEFISLLPNSPLSRLQVYQIVCEAIDNSVKSIEQINTLVRITNLVVDENVDTTTTIPFTPVCNLRFDKLKMEVLLSFMNLSYFGINTTDSDIASHTNFDVIREQFKTSFLTRTIFEAKLMMKKIEDITDFINPLLKVLYAQAVCLVWKEFERYSLVKTLREELSNELNVLNSRWLEVLAGNNWNRYREDLLDQLLVPNREVLLSSKIPLQIFLKSAKKLELALNLIGKTKSLVQFIQESSVSLENENSLSFLETVTKSYFMEEKVHDISIVIDYLNIQRKNYAAYFNFEKLFIHVPKSEKQVMLAILEIVILLLRKISTDGEEDKEEFYSIATCWVSAWLKQIKNLPSDLDTLTLLWINKLSTATSLIATFARNTPKFATEYIEFHAQQLYVPLYYLFLQISDFKSNNFLISRTTELVGIAVSSVPSTTLAFIEPIPSRVCSKFIPLLESSSISIKITAYRILRKVKPKASSGQESDDLPIVPVELNDLIDKYSNEISARDEVQTLNDETIITYLLAWDCLLIMQSERSGSEFANFVKEPHLLPHLLSILFFQLIPLVPEHSIKGFFDSPPQIDVYHIPLPMGHLVCSVIQKTLQCLPYTVRWWWTTILTKQRDKIMVEKFIVKYLSSKLTAEELGKVTWDKASDNITVHSLPGCNELVAHYKIEDTRVSLTISLPLNHPLGPVTIKISDKKLHAKLSNLLNIRSHSLATGLKMWKENLDEKFTHDECSICFFILHGATKALPKLACKVCNNKFHSACLYKWFNTSNKSECPLCRNIF